MPSKRSGRAIQIPLRTAAVYTIAGALWIVLSDLTMDWLDLSSTWSMTLSVVKGWVFVAATALLLYVTLVRQLRSLEHETHEHLKDLDRLSAVQDALQDGLVFYSAVRDGERIVDFRYEHVNSSAERLLGRTGLTGRLLLEMFPSVRTHEAFAQLVRVVETGAPSTEEFSYDADGLKSWFRHTCVKLGDGCVLLFQNIADRKAAEYALQESERQYRELVQHASSIILRLDRNGRVTFINEFAQEYFGYRPDEILGRSVLETIVPLSSAEGIDYPSLFRDLFDRPERYKSNENENVKKNGERVWVSWTNTAVRNEAGELIELLCVGNDITERRGIEQALRLSEQHYRSLFTSMLNGYAYCRMEFDEDGRACDFVYLNVNPAFESLTGLKDVVGRRAAEVIPGVRTTDTELLEAYGRVAQTGVSEQFEYHLRSLSMWLSVAVYSPQRDHFVAVFEVITERKAAEETLKKLSRAVEQSPASIVITGADGAIEYVNPRFCEVTGYSSEEVLGQNPRILKSGKIPGETYRDLWKTLSTGGEWRGEFHNRKKSGELYWELAHISPLLNAQGAITHFIAVKEDITERKHFEQELQRMNRALRALSECNEALVRLPSEARLLEEVCRIIHEVGGYLFAWVGMAEDDADKTLRPTAWAGREEGFLSRVRFTWSETSEWGRGPAGAAARTGKTQVIQDVSKAPEFVPWLEEARKRGYMAAIHFPLMGDGGVMGVLAVLSHEQESFRPEEVKLLEELAEDLAFGMRTLRSRARHAETERALSQSQDRFHRLFYEATEGIVLADMESGVILDCNQAFLQMSGYALDELIGQPQAMFHPDAERSSGFSRSFEQHRNGPGGTVLSAELLCKDGTLKQVEIKASALDFEGRRVMQGFFRDVSIELRHRRERETTLRLLQLVNENTETLSLVKAVTGYLQDWMDCEAVGIRLQEGDDFPYFETRGFSPEFVMTERCLCQRDEEGDPVRDASGDPVLECMCGNVLRGRFDPSKPFFTERGSFWTNCTSDLLATSTEADRLTRTRNRCNGEGYESVALVALRHGAQTLGLIQFNDRRRHRFTPELIAFIENAADQIAVALAQRQSQRALRISEQRFRDVSHAAGEFIWEVDLDARFTYLSDRVEPILGYRPEDLLGKSLYEVVEFPAKPELEAYFQQQVERREGTRGLELSLRSTQGNTVWLRISGLPIFGASGDLQGFRGVAMDETERKLAESEKRRLEVQLHQAQKMESIGRLAGGVAHDFNNMLSIILGYAQFAQKRLDKSDPVYDDVQEILDAVRRSGDLTRQLLAFARQQTTHPRVLDLNETITGMFKMLRRLIGEDIELVWMPGSGVWTTLIDPAQVDQILANLAVNARDAIVENGVITIRTGNATLDASWRPNDPAFIPGDYVLVSVADTGSGIVEEAQEHIFEPFFTTKEMGKGTGLGLSTVYGIVKQNGGLIDVTSAPGQGSTFTIYLPRSADESCAKEAPSDEPELARGSETVLLVEDESGVLSLLQRGLEDLGYTVLSASSPFQAMDIATRHTGPLDLVLTDTIMPGMNGKELVDRLTEVRPGLAIVFMSGYPADVIAKQGVLAEGVRFLHKPFSMESVAAIVRKALDETPGAR